MIELDDNLIFAEGGRRLCFVHPAMPDRCVKTLSEKGDPVLRRRKAAWYKRFRPLAMFDDNLRELESFRALQKNHDEVWSHFPRCHGIEPTNRGAGIVIDMIRDEEGTVSKTLRAYVAEKGKTPEVAGAVNDFLDLLRRRIVLTRDILDHNLLVQVRSDGLRVFMIDGFGSSDTIPVSTWIKWAGRRKVERKIERFRTRYGF